MRLEILKYLTSCPKCNFKAFLIDEVIDCPQCGATIQDRDLNEFKALLKGLGLDENELDDIDNYSDDDILGVI